MRSDNLLALQRDRMTCGLAASVCGYGSARRLGAARDRPASRANPYAISLLGVVEAADPPTGT